MRGRETPSLCLASHGPSVAGTRAAFLALSVRLRVAWVERGGSMFWRKEMGRESPEWMSGM